MLVYCATLACNFARQQLVHMSSLVDLLDEDAAIEELSSSDLSVDISISSEPLSFFKVQETSSC